MKIYGITGGMGSGKSAAAARLADHGFPVIDADRVGHALIASGGAAEAAVREAFAEDDILVEGTIDRGRLGALVFSDPSALTRLNGVVWPILYAEIAAKCAQLAEAGHGVCIVDAAILCEDGPPPAWIDGILLVTAPLEQRIARLVESRGLSATDAASRIAAQRPPEDKAAYARWHVENGGSLDALYRQMDAVAEEMRSDV